MKKAMLIMALLTINYGAANAQCTSNRIAGLIVFNDQWFSKYLKSERTFLDLSVEKRISITETGDIFVNSPNNEKREFTVAIKKKTGEGEAFFYNTSFITLKAQDLLKKCMPGDKILIFLKNNKNFSLPDYVIEVNEGGC